MLADNKRDKTSPLKDFKSRNIDKAYIKANKDKVFDAWKKVWKGSGWADEEFFTRDKDINYIADIAKKGLVYLVEDDKQVIAFAMATVGHFPSPLNSKENKIYQDAKKTLENPAYFHELAVIKDYRGRGIGSALIDMLEKKVQNQGADGAFLWTRKESRSQDLYKKMGYEKLGETTVPKDNKVGKEDRVYFLKKFQSQVS